MALAGAGNLKIGDVVLLYYNADKRFATDSGEKSGFILADLSGSNTQQLLTVRPSETSGLELPNLQFGTFKVLVSNKYEAQTRYRALVEKMKEYKRKKADQSSIQLLQLQLTQAKRDGEVEQAENSAKQRRLQGSSVFYGESIQLQHTLTGKYVCVSTTDTSVTENTKLLVFLQRKDSVGCIFRLHPRIKVQTVGEEVNYDDQIKFESVATEGQYLHCSKKTFGDIQINAFSECYELNLAAKDSPIKIIRHYHPPTLTGSQTDSTLKANGTVRFYHRKHLCYIVGEGSFVGRYGYLPDITGRNNDSMAESIQSSTLNRRKSSVPVVPVGPKTFDVRADMGSISEEVTSAASSPRSPFVFDDLESQEQSVVFSKDGSAALSDPRSKFHSWTRNQGLRKQSTSDNVVSEDVHFRRKNRTRNLSGQTYTSPNAFWQIEKFNQPCSGEPMQWSEQCRIKHLPTRRYLAVTGSDPHYKVTLKSSSLDPSATVFELFPVIQQVGGEIDYESYVRIKHKITGTWLHLNKDLRYHPVESDLDDPLDNLEERKELFQVIATKDINSDDAFTLEKVEDDCVADFNYIAGITAVLANQLQHCDKQGGKTHLPDDCHLAPALSSLKYLHYLMAKKKGKQIFKSNQKFLRGLKTLVLVVRLLDYHRTEDSNDPEVCTACFAIIINFLEGKSTKNKSYVSQMMRHIFTSSVKDTELIGGLTVEKALVGIAKDNPDVLYEAVLMKRMIEYVMQKLRATDKSNDKMIQLLEILSALCACKGVPVLQNQIIILKQLQTFFKEGSDQENKVLYPLRVKPTLEPAENGVESSDIVLRMEDNDAPLITEAPVKLKRGARDDRKSDSSDIQFQASGFKKLQSGHWYELKKGSKQFHKFLVAQIHLLMMMCKGNNTEVIDVLKRLPDTQTFGVQIDFTLIMSAIKDHKIKSSHPQLRAALVELLKVMYVEVGENRPFLEKFPFSFKIDEVGPVPFESTTKGIDPSKAAITALTGVENSSFPTIREWISGFLQDETEYFLSAEEDDKNAVVVRVLQTLTVLIKYGYYDDTSHVNELLPAIHKLLNGSNDFPTRQIKQASELSFKGAMQRKFTNLKRSLTKSSFRAHLQLGSQRGLDSFDFEATLGRELNNDDMREVLRKFRDEGGRYEYSEEQRNHFEIKYWAMEVLNLLFNFQLYKNLHNFIHDFRWLSQPEIVQIRKKKRPTSELELGAVEKPTKLQRELSNLISINPRDLCFFKESPKLAKKVIAAAKERLMYISERTDDSNLSSDENLPRVLLDLANYKYDDLVQRSLLLLDRYYTSQTDIFQKALHTQLLKTAESITLYNTIEGLFLKLVLFLRSGSLERVPGPSPVKELTKYCWLEDEVEGFEPHQINQSIILSFGIFPDVLSYVVQYCNGSSSLFVETEQKQKLIDCLAFLRALACKNEPIQIRLLRHVDPLIKAASGELGPYIGELLREIFTGGPPITLSVKEDQIWKLMSLIFAKGKELNSLTNSSLLSALNELLLVTELDLPLKNNQLLVVRYISGIREDERYWCRDLLAEGMGWRRWEILTSKEDSDPQLINLLMITDLLASCAYGESAGVDAVCCTIYTEEELINIISSDSISIYRKRPFMKLLVWVYMNVHGDKAEERSYHYRRNRLLWDHMTKMAAVLSQVSKAMNRISSSAHLSVKELLTSPMWKYSHECPEQKHPKAPPTVALVGADNYQEHFNISDVLLYVCEGFLPFLQMFYSEFYRKGNYEQTQVEGETTNLLYRAMIAFHEPLNSRRVYFSQEVQVRLYYRVLYLLKPHSTADLTNELIGTEELIEKMRDVFNREIVSLAREKYHEQYEEEVELNTTFNSFVGNYKAAYEGRNVRRDQIIDSASKSKRPSDLEPYSDFLDEDQIKPGPKYLPLGRSFQEHVSIFNASDSKVNNPKIKLLQQLQISLSKVEGSHMITGNFDAERQTELDIKCLQILRASIYNKILLIDEEDKDRNPKKYRKLCELHLHPIQNEIQDLGNSVAQVMPLLSHPDERIVYEVLAFLEAILEFGNDHVQEGLKEVIRSKHQVFPTLKAILKRASIVYQESQLLISLLKARTSFDEKIAFKVEMMKSSTGEEDEPDFSVLSLRQRKSTVQSDGTLVLTAPRRGSALRNLFRKREKTKVILIGDNRVPFMALYQHTDTDDIGAKASSILRFYDLSRITLISKVLGLMCDGQFRSMQNFLREQSEDINSVNMVGEIASFLYGFSKKHVITEKTLTLLTQLLKALNEFCIGNYKNREVTFNENIVSVINFVLQIDITKIKRQGRNENTTVVSNLSAIDDLGISGGKDEKIDYVKLRGTALEMKASAVQLLDALLEEISNKTSRLSHQIAEGLDIHALHWSMLDLFVLKGDPDMVKLKLEDNAYRALFDIYKIIMHLVDTGVAPLQSLKPTEKATLKAWDFCAEKSRSIEVVYKDEDSKEEVLTRVHFNVNIKSDIREHLRDTVKFGVDRSTHADKLRDFHEWMEAVKKDTIHHDWLRRKHLNIVKIFSWWRYWLLLLVTLILNILFIIFFNPEPDDGQLEVICPSIYSFANGSLNEDLPQKYVISTFILGSLYALLAFWMVLEYFVVTWPHFVLPKFLYVFSAKLGENRSISKVLPTFHWTYISVNIFGAKTLFLLILLGIAFSPLYCFGYLYCISFLYIIVNNDILQRTLQAVTKNGKSLLWVAVLLLIITYIYAVLSFAFLRNEFTSDDNPDLFCDTVDQCFISVLRFGLLDSFLEVGVRNANNARIRFFFDITFFIVVTTIGLNIVFGIIVDSFSELRDAKFSAQQDMKSTCFICGLPSHQFERLSNNGFQRHVQNDHNMWTYIYYSMYLDEIDSTNHNAMEKYVYDKMRSGQIDYFPFHQALVLEGQEEDDELKEELEHLQKLVGNRFDSIIHRFDALESLVQEKKTEQ